MRKWTNAGIMKIIQNRIWDALRAHHEGLLVLLYHSDLRTNTRGVQVKLGLVIKILVHEGVKN